MPTYAIDSKFEGNNAMYKASKFRCRQVMRTESITGQDLNENCTLVKAVLRN